MKRIAILSCIATLLGGTVAFAEGGALVPPITDAATLKECGACHMAFPPQFLPARSWEKLMGNLANHFGENASLPETARAEIAAYLTAHAADAPTTQHGKRFMRGIAAGATPLRVTETPFWQEGHSEISPGRFASPAVKTAANCMACHRDAGQGAFGEEE